MYKEVQEVSFRKLKDLIKGGTVVDVLDNPRSEGLFTLVVDKADDSPDRFKTLIVPIFGTDLGWWISGEHENVDGKETFRDAPTLLKAMADWCYEQDMISNGTCSFRVINPSTGPSWVTFVIYVEGTDISEEFWIRVGDISGPWAEPLICEKGRKWIASHESKPAVWEYPDPREIDLDGGSWKSLSETS